MLRKKKKPVSKTTSWKSGRSKPTKNRRSGKRMSGFGRFLILALLVVFGGRFVAGAILEKVKSHPVFTVRRVVVEGADYLEPEGIITAADVETGVNIFDVTFEPIVTRLDEKFAAEDFTVFRRLPDTITIRVRERKPVALLNMNELVGVDEEGVPLPHIGASMAETLPIITGIRNISSLADTTVRDRLVKGIRLLDSISEQSPSVYGRISEVDVSDMTELGITLIDNGLEVIIGDDEWSRKISVLEKVINKVPENGEKIKAIDIRFAEKIFFRKK